MPYMKEDKGPYVRNEQAMKALQNKESENEVVAALRKECDEKAEVIDRLHGTIMSQTWHIQQLSKDAKRDRKSRKRLEKLLSEAVEAIKLLADENATLTALVAQQKATAVSNDDLLRMYEHGIRDGQPVVTGRTTKP